jgi:hypothetical protein
MKRLILPSRWGFRNVSSSWVSKPGRCIRISIFSSARGRCWICSTSIRKFTRPDLARS